MSYSRKETGPGVIFSLVAVALYAGPYVIVVTTDDAMGLQFFPRIVAICMGILAVTQVASGLKKERREQESGERNGFNTRAAATIGILFTYVPLVRTVGSIIMTAVHLLAQILLLLPKRHPGSGKDILITAIISVVMPILICELFCRAFSIFPPTGLLR